MVPSGPEDCVTHVAEALPVQTASLEDQSQLCLHQKPQNLPIHSRQHRLALRQQLL